MTNHEEVIIPRAYKVLRNGGGVVPSLLLACLTFSFPPLPLEVGPLNPARVSSPPHFKL